MSTSDYHEKFQKSAAIAVRLFHLLNELFKSKPKGILHGSRRSQMHNPKSFILGGLVGVAAGVVTAFLFAPKAGKDLRHALIHPFNHNGEHPHPTHKHRKSAKRRVPKSALATAEHTLKRVAKSVEKHTIPKKRPKRHTDE